MDDVYIAWRIGIGTTHCNLLPHFTEVMDPELWFSKIYIKFIKMALNSDNNC